MVVGCVDLAPSEHCGGEVLHPHLSMPRTKLLVCDRMQTFVLSSIATRRSVLAQLSTLFLRPCYCDSRTQARRDDYCCFLFIIIIISIIIMIISSSSSSSSSIIIVILLLLLLLH